MRFCFHRQLLHGLAATAGVPLRAEQRSVAFRERVEKSDCFRLGESGQIKPDRNFRRSGISHRLPRTGSHPFVLRNVAVGSVSAQLTSIRQLAKKTPAQLIPRKRGRGGQDSIASDAETTESTVTGKSACCGIFFKKWHIAAS
jgi:hypothetical protein